MNRTKTTILLLVALVLALAGASCSGGNADKAALVNGEAVTMRDLDAALRNVTLRMGPMGGTAGTGVTDETRETLGPQILDQLINTQLLFQEAQKAGFKADQAKVEEEFNKINGRFETPEKFKEELANRLMDEAMVRQDLARQVSIRAYLEESLVKSLTVSDEEAKGFYDQNSAQFAHGEEVRASHVLVRVDSGASEADQKAALAKAQALVKEASKPGADFAELAKANPGDPGSAAKGGDLGFFAKGMMVPEFEKTAFSLPVGKLSAPVKTQFGYHVIKVTDRRKAGTAAFEEVKPNIVNFLLNQKKQKALEDKLAELKKGARIENYFQKKLDKKLAKEGEDLPAEMGTAPAPAPALEGTN